MKACDNVIKDAHNACDECQSLTQTWQQLLSDQQQNLQQIDTLMAKEQHERLQACYLTWIDRVEQIRLVIPFRRCKFLLLEYTIQ